MTVTTYTARRNSLLAVCHLDLPGSAYHHTLCPRLHDLHEGAMVEEATLPGTLWSWIYREEAWLVWQRVQQKTKKKKQNRVTREKIGFILSTVLQNPWFYSSCSPRLCIFSPRICNLGSNHDGWLYKAADSTLFLPVHPDKHAQPVRLPFN